MLQSQGAEYRIIGQGARLGTLAVSQADNSSSRYLGVIAQSSP